MEIIQPLLGCQLQPCICAGGARGYPNRGERVPPQGRIQGKGIHGLFWGLAGDWGFTAPAGK